MDTSTYQTIVTRHRELLKITAQSLVEDAAKVTKRDRVLVWYDTPAREFARLVADYCRKNGASVSFFERDLQKRVEEIREGGVPALAQIFHAESHAMKTCDVVILLRGPQNPDIVSVLSPDVYREMQAMVEEIHRPRVAGTLRWTLFYWPTEYEARQEGKTYAEYFTEYFEACRAPWHTIQSAQEHLVNELNQGQLLELFANTNDSDPRRRTSVRMSIAGMTFCNSTIDNNYPGAEVFSAPVLESVEGHIFAPGTYEYQGKRMTNIYLDIHSGVIQQSSYAEEGNDALQEILSLGIGARYFGEVALGTNPFLTRRWFNPLMNEKVGGSFHMAIGHCYTFTSYGGSPIVVNNGNTPDRTSVHWDLTVMMKPEYGGGAVIVDGRLIQKDGYFFDSQLLPLNASFYEKNPQY